MRLLPAPFRILLLLTLGLAGGASPAAERPNFVVILCDDLGYADIAPFGSDVPTPNLDRLAREGRKFTDFYVGQPICSASRAALLTGCYPNRVGILGALGPHAKIGLSAQEKTIAEVLKPAGYATALIGKWHLGDAPQFLPTRHGFDQYFGLLYSNDMWPNHPTNGKNYPPLPLYEGEKVTEIMPDQTQLTTRYTERAVQFIGEHQAEPFFLEVAHNMPHVPLHVSSKFKGKSPRGLYGDVVMEIDWSVGLILDALQKAGLDRKTLVLFTSDNGPWLLYGNHAGRAEPLREGKATTFDGGDRVPFLLRWPGRVAPGTVSAELLSTIDLLPTFAKLAGAELPAAPIDGLDAWPLMAGELGAKSPHEAFAFYFNDQLQALRSGSWKLHFAHPYTHPDPPGADGLPGHLATLNLTSQLFDLKADPGESTDVAAAHPEIVQRLQALAEQTRIELGDTKRPGRGQRPAGHVEEITGTAR